MYRIRTHNQIAPLGLQQLPASDFEVGEGVTDPDGILLRSFKLSPADISDRLRAIARAGAGVNNVPVAHCTERGVVVFNTPGANANSVKELVLAALFLSSRDILGGMTFVAGLASVAGAQDLNALVEAEKKRFRGRELHGKSLAVVGLGAIGSLVARAALDLGMDVLGYDPAISVDAAWRLPAEVRRMDSLASLFARSDFITLHVPLLPATAGMIGDEALAAVRRGSVLLNFARESIVDQGALIRALDAGRLGLYVADFPAPELIGRSDVRLMPHLGASTAEAEENCAVMAARQLGDFLESGNITNSVNFPTVSLEPSDGYRLAIANRNVAGMLGQVTSVLAAHDINIIDILNKSRGEVAYNLLDIETEPGPALVAELNAVDSVINVRVLNRARTR